MTDFQKIKDRFDIKNGYEMQLDDYFLLQYINEILDILIARDQHVSDAQSAKPDENWLYEGNDLYINNDDGMGYKRIGKCVNGKVVLDGDRAEANEVGPTYGTPCCGRLMFQKPDTSKACPYCGFRAEGAK